MTHPTFGRRAFLRSGTAVALAGGALTQAGSATAASSDETFTYEIVRSDEEWRSMLSEHDYGIMREDGTEKRHTSGLVNESREGTYHCKGCDLTLYESHRKVPLQIGWVFFSHALHDTVLLGTDEQAPYGGAMDEGEVLIEVHCRRCSSHLGHMVYIDPQIVHCINGSAMNFRAASA
jgi:peptide-methionine (R)-S-oxide reductase